MKKINLGGNRYENKPIKDYALVDDDIFDYLNQFKWWLTDNGYAISTKKTDSGRTRIRMSREVINCPNGYFVDHIDGNKLNNQKSNLRIATKSQNGMNRGRPASNTSGYKGVSWDKHTLKWRAEIKANGKRYRLGRFLEKVDAAKAYFEAARKLHKDFAHI